MNFCGFVNSYYSFLNYFSLDSYFLCYLICYFSHMIKNYRFGSFIICHSNFDYSNLRFLLFSYISDDLLL